MTYDPRFPPISRPHFPRIATREPETPSERAAEIVRGPRQNAYGHPLDNHERIARFFTARLWEKLDDPLTNPITPEEACSLIRLMKEARLIQTPGHDDSLVDIAGYADVEWEIHKERERRETGSSE